MSDKHTWLEALNLGGGDDWEGVLQTLERTMACVCLNMSSENIDYPYTPNEVNLFVQQTYTEVLECGCNLPYRDLSPRLSAPWK